MSAGGQQVVQDVSTDAPRRVDFADATRLPAVDKLVATATDRLAEALERELGSALRFSVVCTSAGVKRRAHREIVAERSSGAPCMPLALSNPTGESWLLIERGLAFALADRRYGGPGAVQTDDRALSASEWRLCTSLRGAICRALERAWAPVTALSVRAVSDGNADSASADAERFASSPADGLWHECLLNIDAGNGPANCALLLGHPAVAQLAPRSAAPVVHRLEHARKFGEELAAGVRGCGIELVGVLAERGMTLGELATLDTGDFFALDERRPVSFRANGRPLFDARLELDAGRLCASVTRLHLPTAED